MKRIAKTLWLVIALIAFFSFSSAQAPEISPDQKLQVVKLGYITGGTNNIRLPNLAIESQIAKRNSFQVEFGYWRIGMPRNGSRVFTDQYLHFGAEFRGYLFLRQAKELCGFYLAPYLAYDRKDSRFVEWKSTAYRRYGTSGGLGIGFQQAFGGHFRAEGGIKIGYSLGTFTDRLDENGLLVNQNLNRNHFVGNALLTIGYAF